MDDDLTTLIRTTERYYKELIERGIPEALAVRIVGDWYQALTRVASAYFDNRMIRARDTFTQRMAREVSE